MHGEINCIKVALPPGRPKDLPVMQEITHRAGTGTCLVTVILIIIMGLGITVTIVMSGIYLIEHGQIFMETTKIGNISIGMARGQKTQNLITIGGRDHGNIPPTGGRVLIMVFHAGGYSKLRSDY